MILKSKGKAIWIDLFTISGSDSMHVSDVDISMRHHPNINTVGFNRLEEAIKNSKIQKFKNKKTTFTSAVHQREKNYISQETQLGLVPLAIIFALLKGSPIFPSSSNLVSVSIKVLLALIWCP